MVQRLTGRFNDSRDNSVLGTTGIYNADFDNLFFYCQNDCGFPTDYSLQVFTINSCAEIVFFTRIVVPPVVYPFQNTWKPLILKLTEPL